MSPHTAPSGHRGDDSARERGERTSEGDDPAAGPAAGDGPAATGTGRRRRRRGGRRRSGRRRGGRSAAASEAKPDQSTADQAPTGEPKTGEPKTGEPKTGEPKTGEPKTGDTAADKPTTGRRRRSRGSRGRSRGRTAAKTDPDGRANTDGSANTDGTAKGAAVANAATSTGESQAGTPNSAKSNSANSAKSNSAKSNSARSTTATPAKRKSTAKRKTPAKRGARGARRRMEQVDEVSAGGVVVEGTGPAARAVLIGKIDRRGRLVWSLPKGHVEQGETFEQTAAREVEEETGILGDVVAVLGTVDYWFVADGRRIHKTVHHFLLRAVGGELSDEDVEVEEVAWVPVTELADRLAYPDERRLVERIPAMLATPA